MIIALWITSSYLLLSETKQPESTPSHARSLALTQATKAPRSLKQKEQENLLYWLLSFFVT